MSNSKSTDVDNVPSRLLTFPAGFRVPWKLVFGGPYALAFGSSFFFRLQLFIAAPAGLIMGWHLLDFLDGPLRTVMSLVIGWPIAGALLSATTMWRVATVHLCLDEGGVRCRARGRSAYWPFELTGRGYIEGGALPELVIEDRDGSVVIRVPVVGAAGHATGTALLARYESQRQAVGPAKGVGIADMVDRKGRSIDAWSEALDALSGQADEPGPPDTSALLDLLADRGRRAEIRAGAAYVLLAQPSPELIEETRELLSAASPPIVLLLARIAPGGDALGLNDALRRAAPYLDVDDQCFYADLRRSRSALSPMDHPVRSEGAAAVPVATSASKQSKSQSIPVAAPHDDRAERLLGNLLSKCMGNNATAERLIKYEGRMTPNAGRAELIQSAIERWEQDNR